MCLYLCIYKYIHICMYILTENTTILEQNNKHKL